MDGHRTTARFAGRHRQLGIGTADDAASLGKNADAVFDREGEMLSFLAGYFGPYPFSTGGGIVQTRRLGFALETQTRPIYSPEFFVEVPGGTTGVVHELSHQWVGDSLSIRRWRNIWLNEGFATYVEWLWSEHEGGPTPPQIFDNVYENLPDDFFTILHRWTTRHAGGNVSTAQFIALAERVSGRDLDGFFHRWLFAHRRPADPSPRAQARMPAPAAAAFFAKQRELLVR